MKSIGLTTSLSALLLGGFLASVLVLPSQAVESDTPEQPDYRIVDSDSLLGSYLAGRLARSLRDNEKAADYYHEALDKDPRSKEILEEAFQLKVATGDFESARGLAHDLIVRNDEHKVANFFLGIEAFKNGEHKQADKYFRAGGVGPIADLTARLVRAWVALDQDRVEQALKLTGNADSARTEGAQQIEMLHRAMIADVADRRRTAQALYKRLHKASPRNIRITVAYARHAAHWKNVKLAKSLLKEHMDVPHPNPLVRVVAEAIEAGETPPLAVASAADGVAAVFQGIGEALTGDGVVDAGQVYLQLALFTDPDSAMAHYALGELYDQLQKHRAAQRSFAQVPEDSPLWLNAQMGQAYALNSLKKVDAARVLLEDLIKAYPDDNRPYSTMGTILRANEKYEEAITYYTQAIERLGPETTNHWSAYYSRGVCYERVKEWKKAEADLQKALELDPDQELALNYLGYSWVDQNMRVKEAMDLIRRAVDKRPNDGYFVDSLGWAHYRQDEFDQAVKYLERAVELKPDDPVINDHLGDAYWKVGRELEASYQWQYALGLDPDPEEEAKIREKLEKGLIEPKTTRASLDENGTQAVKKTR